MRFPCWNCGRDIEAARAKAAGSPPPARKYGAAGQGAAGLDRALNADEMRMLCETLSARVKRDDMLSLVSGWGYGAEDAANLVDDALAASAALIRR